MGVSPISNLAIPGGGGNGSLQEFDWKEAVETFAISNIVLSGEQTISSLLTDKSRVLLGGQTDKTENGIYISDPGAWSRAPDADTDAKVTNGLAVLVGDSGSTEAGNAYFLQTPDPITLGVTDLTFAKFNSDHRVFLFFTRPGVGDDINGGFRIGDVAVVFTVTPREIYQCADNAAGAAVWLLTSDPSLDYLFYADQLDNPNNADWVVNNLAAVDTDSNNNALKIRKHDDTVETGFGFILEVPDFAKNVTFTFKSRAETGPGAVRTVGLKVYERDIGDNVAVGAWSAGVVLTDIDIPTNERFQYDSQTLSLAAVGLVAGQTHQLEITRIAPTGGTDLTGDWNLLSIGVKFS